MQLSDEFLRAETLARKRSFAEAERVLRRIMDGHPEHPRALIMLGNIAAHSGDLASALSYFSRCESVAPGDGSVLVHRARALAMHGRWMEAVEAYRRAVALEPARGDLHRLLGTTQLRAGLVDESLQTLLHSLALEAHSAQTHGDLGAVLKRLGRIEESVSHYRSAVALDPGFAPAYANLGEACVELGRLDEALEWSRQAVALAPHQPEAHVHLGMVYRARGELDAAVAAYREAIRIAPGTLDAWLNLGNALKENTRWDDAREAYQRVLNLDPSFVQAHISIAAIELAQGNAGEALTICDHCLETQPRSGLAMACRWVAINELSGTGSASHVSAEQLVSIFTPGPPVRGESLDQFNQSLVDRILTHPSLTDAPASHATREAKHSGELSSDEGPFAHFEVMVRGALREYLAAHRDEAYFDTPELDPRLNVWSVVMRSGGHQIPHIHPTAWMSGVYYPLVPDWADADSPAGCIEFGQIGREFHHTRETPTFQIRPRPGLLVMFPSFLYHHTVPMETDALRVSIAFDFTVQR